MTQKNGTIEFIKGDSQSPNVYIKDIKKLVHFDKMSSKLFTFDPVVIKVLDSLGYKRGKIKIDGVAVLASNMTDDEVKRAQRSLERQAEKSGVEVPEVKIEKVEEIKKEEQVIIDHVKSKLVSDIDVDKVNDQEEIEEVKEEPKYKEKAKKKKVDSYKLKKEIENK